MSNVLISLPDSNLAVDNRFTGSKTKKAGDSSGSTENRKEKTESFSEVKQSLKKRTGRKTEMERPAEQIEEKEKKSEEKSAADTGMMAGVASSYIHPETETVPSLENAVSEETMDAGAVKQANIPVVNVSTAYMAKNTAITKESYSDSGVLQTSGISAEQQVYEEMDNISIAARSFSDSVSTIKNNPAKTETTSPQETTAVSTDDNKTDPLDKLFQKDTGEPATLRETVKVREKTTEGVSEKIGEKVNADASDRTSSGKPDSLRHDFKPFKGDLPEDIMEKNILGNFKLREFFNSINGKTPLQPNGLNAIKASLESIGNSTANLKLNAAFQDGDTSGKFVFNINTNKEMLKIKTQAEGGIAGLEGFKNLVESRIGDNMKKISAPSQVNENSMTDVTSTVRQNPASSAEIKDNNDIPTISKERFTDYFVSKAREFFADSVEGKKILKVIITPPDLGEVKVTMEMKKNVLHASFHCTPEAARAINSQVQNLSRSLSNVGIQLGSSNIDTGQHNTNSQNNSHSQGYNHTSKSDGDVFLSQAADEGISAENSKVFNVLI